jgi:hypothetical protein
MLAAMDNKFTFRCSTCGEIHTDLPDLAFGAPFHYKAMSEDERRRSAKLIFVDADTVVTAEATRAAVAAMRGAVVGAGWALRFDDRLPLYGRLLAAVTVPLYRVLGLGIGCFLFCTRQAFHSVGGYNEGLFSAEEAAMSRALRRQGRFVVLREHVTTSGRKLRAYSTREVLGLLARLGSFRPEVPLAAKGARAADRQWKCWRRL